MNIVRKCENTSDLAHIFQGMRVATGNRACIYKEMSLAQSVAFNSFFKLFSPPKAASHLQGTGDNASRKPKRESNSS